jgi:hypothetical protein
VKKPLLADFAPYIYRTRDFGRTWTKIVNGIRADDYIHAVREDPTRQGLLYAAAQHGVYVSYDDGETWQSLSLNLPDVPVSDLWVEADALAIATHGRSFYVLDNIAALRQAGMETAGAAFHLYKPADAIRTVSGASISYLLRKPAQKLTIEILDDAGAVVQTIQGTAPQAGGGQAGRGGGGQGGQGGRGRGGAPSASMAAGFNRANWNLAYPGAVTFPGMILWGATTNGPLALPGTYQVRLTVDGVTQTQPLVVRKHPLRNIPDADIAEQFNLALQIRDKISEANNAVINIRRIKTDVAAALGTSKDGRLKTAGDRLTAALSAVEQDIYQVKNQSGQDPLNFPIKTNNRLASLLGMTLRGEGKPTANTYPIFEDLKKELKAETDRLDRVLATELAAFNREAVRLKLAPIDR